MIVNAIWIGDTFPILQQICANSWLAHGHSYTLWAYKDIPGVPDGVTIRDANLIMGEPILRYTDANHKDSPVLHANLFRYKFHAKYGGTFIDADTLCLSDCEHLPEFCISSERVGNPHPNLAFIRTPRADTDFGNYCWETASSRLNGNPVWGYYGPRIVREAVEALNLHEYLLAPKVFCPISYNQLHYIFSSDVVDFDEEVCGIQLWQQTITKNGIDLNDKYPKSSLWEQWKEEYL